MWRFDGMEPSGSICALEGQEEKVAKKVPWEKRKRKKKKKKENLFIREE
jgi:hypothetical protein